MNLANIPLELGGTHELVITRAFKVPPALAFSVWTSREHLVRWWGPRDETGVDYSTPHCESDFRPGGRYRICIRSPQGKDSWLGGEYREIEPPGKIVLTFQWEADGHPMTLIELRFEDDGAGGTRFHFRQRGLPDAASRDMHEIGWNRWADRLRDYLDTLA
ncbi:SRPBCC domain-containing protein [Niveibacterium sp. SC-1]|uniref:SRPBCC family protein n=1 Tax=Niveibacterium sp. SC-1 TaxID=3135646 RepID=UPI00311F0AAD